MNFVSSPQLKQKMKVRMTSFNPRQVQNEIICAYEAEFKKKKTIFDKS